MEKERLAAFSDGVIAIIITIMVLELKAPLQSNWQSLLQLLPTFLSYVLSFVYVAIYWNNHHHLLHAVDKVNGAILWANMHLLFWLSLVPFATAWLGNTHFTELPTALYGFIMLMPAVAYFFLQKAIIRHQGRDGKLAQALGNDFKGKISLVLNMMAIGLAFVAAWIAQAIFVLVALIWLVPDKRIEKVLREEA